MKSKIYLAKKMQNKRHLFTTKTFKAGLLEMSVGFFDIFSGQAFVCTFYGFKAGWILVFFGALKMVLRYVTKNRVRIL